MSSRNSSAISAVLAAAILNSRGAAKRRRPRRFPGAFAFFTLSPDYPASIESSSKATILVILIMGLIAGPAVSL